jgi:hypothetical protein
VTRVTAVAAIGACVVFALSWSLLHRGWFGRGQIGDTPTYQAYDAKMRDGQIPYRDFQLEYPPGALPIFLVAPPSYDDASGYRFQRDFGFVMEACGFALVLLTAVSLARITTPAPAAAALAVTSLAPLVLGSVILTRYDLWPAALTAGAIAALVWELDLVGAAILGVAVAAKLYPAVLAPIAFTWVWRRLGRRAAARWTTVLVASAACFFLPFAIVAPDGLGHSFGEQLTRPLQIESLGAALLVALHHLAGLHLSVSSTHGSQNFAGTLPDGIGTVTTVLEAVALVGVWTSFARGPATHARLVAASAAAVTAFIAFGKVFSPQYLIWLIPLVPLVRGARGVAASALMLVTMALTQAWFPHHYWDYALRIAPLQSWLVFARDFCTLMLLAVLVWPPLEDEPLGEGRAMLEALQRVRAQVE